MDFVIIPRKVASAAGDDSKQPPPTLTKSTSTDSEDPDGVSIHYPQDSPLEIGDIRERLQLNASNGWKFLEMKSNPTKDEQLFRSMTQRYTQKLLVNYNNDPFGGKNKKKGRKPNINNGSSKPMVNGNESNSNVRRYKRVVVVVDRRDVDVNSPIAKPVVPKLS